MKADNRIKVTLIYDISPKVETADYEVWARKSAIPLSQAKGLIEARAYRNALKPTQVKIVTSWRSFLDWGKFTESSAWKEIKDELTSFIATGIDICVWKPSPLFPEDMTLDPTADRKKKRK